MLIAVTAQAMSIKMLDSDSCTILEVRQSILSVNDDAEESSAGIVSLNSSDLDLGVANGEAHTIGLRFDSVRLPNNAQVVESYIHFTSKEISNTFASLDISGELDENSIPYIDEPNNLTLRVKTAQTVSWVVDSWTSENQKEEQQKSSDLSEIVQSMIDQPNWESGNSLSFLLEGIGSRTAMSYDHNPASAPELVIRVVYPETDTLISDVYINEIMPSNNIIRDPFGETDDWFEIYNGNSEALYLGDLYLTDDADDLKKWQVTNPELIQPLSFGIIWADDNTDQGWNHAPFKLKSSGEFIALSQELNDQLYILDSLTFPSIPDNASYGRKEDGNSEWVTFGELSPQGSNNDKRLLLQEPVTFSTSSGSYQNEFFLELETANSDVEIFYTLDGSTPTRQDLAYNEQFLIDRTLMVTAKAFKQGFESIEESKAFYIIDNNSEIGILNIDSKPENLWDDMYGIYVSGINGALDYCNEELNNWNQSWERPCQISLYDADGSLAFDVNAGMKIGGACSRNLKMKSFNIFMRKNEYGEDRIFHPIFGDSNVSDFKRIKIRNGGTDWNEMLFRDGMNSLLLKNTVDLDILDYRPVKVYLNGNYWGVYGIREMFSKHYAESHHGVSPDSLDILGDPYGPRQNIREGDRDRYDEMTSFLASNTLSNNENYQIIQDYIDIDEYLNYHIAQIYLANFDWPGNNVRIWRDRNNGKFRWMMFDTDASSGWSQWGPGVATATHNTLQHAINEEPANMFVPGFTEWPNGAESTLLFRQMLENDNFKNEFIQRTCSFRELIYNKDRVNAMTDSVAAMLRPEIQEHINMWLGNDEFGVGIPCQGSMSEWESSVSNYKNFFANRSLFILTFYQTTLGLGPRFKLKFNINELSNGHIKIHSNNMQVPYGYEGEYFRNIPITITAVPEEGYFFSHWEETGETNATIHFVSNADFTLTPVFSDVPVSVSNVERFQFRLFPNPASDNIKIILPEKVSDPSSITIYNCFSQVLLHNSYNDANLKAVEYIDLTGFSSGVYFLEYRFGQERSISKFVVE